MERHHFRLIGLIAILSLSLTAPPAWAELKFYLATTAGLTLSDNPLYPGKPLTLTGSVKDASGAPVTAGVVQIQVAEAPEGPWMVLDVGELDVQGRFQVVDFMPGLKTRPLFVRARYRGHEAGRVCYAPAVSPAVPLIFKAGAGLEEALEIGFVEARGDGAPGTQGTGPWEFMMRVKALKDQSDVVFQGSTSDWVPLHGASWDFQADGGRVTARVLEGDGEEILVVWHLGDLWAGEEATLRVRVDGVIVDAETECDAALPLGGAGVASCREAGGLTWRQVRVSEPVSLTVSCPGPE